MTKLYYSIIGFILSLQLTFADGGILGNFKEGDAAKTETAIRKGEIVLEDIPVILKGAIDFFIAISGTVAIIFIIIGAYKILFGSLEQETSEGKNTIIMAIGGFAIASLAWFIVKLIIDNLS